MEETLLKTLANDNAARQAAEDGLKTYWTTTAEQVREKALLHAAGNTNRPLAMSALLFAARNARSISNATLNRLVNIAWQAPYRITLSYSLWLQLAARAQAPAVALLRERVQAWLMQGAYEDMLAFLRGLLASRSTDDAPPADTALVLSPVLSTLMECPQYVGSATLYEVLLRLKTPAIHAHIFASLTDALRGGARNVPAAWECLYELDVAGTPAAQILMATEFPLACFDSFVLPALRKSRGVGDSLRGFTEPTMALILAVARHLSELVSGEDDGQVASLFECMRILVAERDDDLTSVLLRERDVYARQNMWIQAAILHCCALQSCTKQRKLVDTNMVSAVSIHARLWQQLNSTLTCTAIVVYAEVLSICMQYTSDSQLQAVMLSGVMSLCKARPDLDARIYRLIVDELCKNYYTYRDALPSLLLSACMACFALLVTRRELVADSIGLVLLNIDAGIEHAQVKVLLDCALTQLWERRTSESPLVLRSLVSLVARVMFKRLQAAREKARLEESPTRAPHDADIGSLFGPFTHRVMSLCLPLDLHTDVVLLLAALYLRHCEGAEYASISAMFYDSVLAVREELPGASRESEELAVLVWYSLRLGYRRADSITFSPAMQGAIGGSVIPLYMQRVTNYLGDAVLRNVGHQLLRSCLLLCDAEFLFANGQQFAYLSSIVSRCVSTTAALDIAAIYILRVLSCSPNLEHAGQILRNAFDDNPLVTGIPLSTLSAAYNHMAKSGNASPDAGARTRNDVNKSAVALSAGYALHLMLNYNQVAAMDNRMRELQLQEMGYGGLSAEQAILAARKQNIKTPVFMQTHERPELLPLWAYVAHIPAQVLS